AALVIENDALLTEDELRELLQRERASTVQGGERRAAFPGIALSPESFVGRVQRSRDLLDLLRKAAEGTVELGPQTVLVVPTLEPSWAVVFGRVGAVVAEMGGELSHASILLREAGKPAIVNCAGIFASLRDGDEVELDGESEQVLLRPAAVAD
ncbi:MAG: PEP-utilizing enzyme, partial [Planctomycetota bacterium]